LERQNQSNFWKWFLLGNNNTRQEDGITVINLNGENNTERVLQTDEEVLVQQKDKNTGEWITEYKKTKIAPIKYKILADYLNPAKQNVVVICYWMGNGGFLTYTIIGRKKGTIVELAGNEDVYKGDIFFEDGKLIENRDSRYSKWVIKDNRFNLIPYKIPKIPGALRIEYYLYSDGQVKIKNKHYTVPVGTIVQVIRTDLSSIPEKRFTYGVDKGQHIDIIKDLPEFKEAFKIVKKGKVEVKIAPDLDWEKSFIITIEAI
jgi:hypothetical protein